MKLTSSETAHREKTQLWGRRLRFIKRGKELTAKMDQLVTYLSCKHEDQSLIPRIQVKRQIEGGGACLKFQYWGNGDK